MMPRVPNTRPTAIYWLIDTRAETIAVVGPQGYPFYCGKTVLDPVKRFSKHRTDARLYPTKAISKHLAVCGEYVRIQVMEIVSPSDSWAKRERHWIAMLRFSFPGAVNVAAGGQGAPGCVPSEEARRKRSASLKGRIFSDEHRARIGKASANRAPEVYVKIGESQKGRIASPETRAKLSAAGLGRKLSIETRNKMSIAVKSRSPEVFAKIGAKLKGRVFSDETLAKMGAAQRRRYQTLRDANA